MACARYRTRATEPISINIWAALLCIECYPVEMKVIARQCEFSTANMTGLADRMEALKLARRVTGKLDPVTGRIDRRRVRLEILPAGRQALEALRKAQP